MTDEKPPNPPTPNLEALAPLLAALGLSTSTSTPLSALPPAPDPPSMSAQVVEPHDMFLALRRQVAGTDSSRSLYLLLQYLRLVPPIPASTSALIFGMVADFAGALIKPDADLRRDGDFRAQLATLVKQRLLDDRRVQVAQAHAKHLAQAHDALSRSFQNSVDRAKALLVSEHSRRLAQVRDDHQMQIDALNQRIRGLEHELHTSRRKGGWTLSKEQQLRLKYERELERVRRAGQLRTSALQAELDALRVVQAGGPSQAASLVERERRKWEKTVRDLQLQVAELSEELASKEDMIDGLVSGFDAKMAEMASERERAEGKLQAIARGRRMSAVMESGGGSDKARRDSASSPVVGRPRAVTISVPPPKRVTRGRSATTAAVSRKE